MSLVALDPNSKVGTTFTDAATFTNAMVNGGFIPILPDGTAAKVYSFEGGYLVQGAPLNVWFSGVWYDGQAQLLIPHWQAGDIVTPPAELLNLPTVPAPADVVATYAAYKAAPATVTTLTQAYQQAGTAPAAGAAGSIPWTYIAIGVGALMLFGGGSSKRREPSSQDWI